MKPFAAADPYVLRVGDSYYLYTAAPEDGAFQVRTSQDLTHWSAPRIIFRADESFWGRDCFWAPECHVIGGRYWLFFSANQKSSSALQSFAITAVCCDTPDGDFRDVLGRPLLAPGYPVIDGNILCEDGHVYLYYSRCCFEHEVDGLEESWIYGVQLKPDLSGTLGEPVLLLKPEQPWQGRSVPTTRRRWNEGSFILKDGSRYYMIYSANCYLQPHYAMGYAVSASPMGPFVKAEENPIVCCTDAITGTGHGCLVQGPEGLTAVYHGRTASTGDERVAFRAPAALQNGRLVIRYQDAVMFTGE